MKSKLVCLVGIDGCGKSTQSQQLVAFMNGCGFSAAYVWNRWEPRLVKVIVDLFLKKKPSVKGSDSESYGKRLDGKKRMLRNPIVCFFWFVASIAEYYLQTRKRLYPVLKRNDIVVCDRYYFDYIVDQAINAGSNFNNLPRWVVSLLRFLFPQPDFLFILDLTPEEAQIRKKGEDCLEYLSDRRDLYLRFQDCICAHVISANESISCVQENLRRIVMEKV